MELLQIYPVNECIGPMHTCMFVSEISTSWNE